MIKFVCLGTRESFSLSEYFFCCVSCPDTLLQCIEAMVFVELMVESGLVVTLIVIVVVISAIVVVVEVVVGMVLFMCGLLHLQFSGQDLGLSPGLQLASHFYIYGMGRVNKGKR